MERASKNVRSFGRRFLIPLLVLGTALVFTNCSSLKQLFDLKGIIVSKDDQIFQGESATVTIDVSDANKSYSFKATSDPVDNGYPIKFETSNTSTVRVSQSASDPSSYTINAVNPGWCDVTVMCSVAYKFNFIVYVTDKAKGVTVSSLSSQRDEHYARLAETERAVQESTPTAPTPTAPTSTAATTTPAVVQLTSASNVKVSSSASQVQVGKTCTFTADIGNVTEPVSYQWYIGNGTAIPNGTGKSLTVPLMEVGTYSCYVQVKGAKSGITKKSATVSVEAVKEKVYVNASTPIKIQSDATSVELYYPIKFTSTIGTVDEELLYQWYSNGKALGVKGANDGRQANLEHYAPIEAGSYSVYLEVTGATSGNKIKSSPITVTYKLVDHRPEFAGAWLPVKNNGTGKYVAADGKIYDMYQISSTEWVYKPEAVALMASTGYLFTDYVSTNKTRCENGKLIVKANNVETTYSKYSITPRVAKYVGSSTSVTVAADSTTVEIGSAAKFTSKVSALDEDVTYQWYVGGKAITGSSKAGASGNGSDFEFVGSTAATLSVYLEVTGKTSGNKAKSAAVNVTFKAFDHRSEFAGAWVKDKLKASGKYMTADGKIYDMYWDGEGAGEWIYKPEVVATMAATGYEITDHVAANKTKIVDGKIVVTTDKVDLVCSKSVITPRIAKYVDSSTKVTISADKTSVEAGNGSVTITSNVPALDENVTYQWYINGSAANNSRSANSYYEDECSEPRTFEYYVVVKGKKSGKSVTSNKVSVTFKLVDHRPEFTGLWVSEKNNGSAFTILSDGSVMGTYCDADTNEWIYRPTVEAVMRSSGYSFEDKISNQYVSIKDGKLKVVNKGTETLYNKASDVSSRAQKMISSDTKYVLTASQSTVPVNTDVTLKTTLTNCDEEIDFQWFCDDKKESSSKVTAYKFVTQYSEPMTHSYYVVATGRTSKKTVKSNVVTIKFVMDSIRPEMAGAWVNKSNSNDAVYFKPNGQLFKINKKSGSDWYFMPNPIGELADDSAVINETDPSTYKIWVNRTEGTLYIETNGKKSEYKQNKSIKAREGKFISSITQKITPTLSKTKIAANDNPASLTITLPTAAFDALDEGVTYQWINAETGGKFKNATTPTYTFTRSDSKTADEVINRAVRVTGNITGVTYTTEAATFTVEARDQRTDMVGFWAQSASDTSGYVIMSNGMVYKAFAKKKTEGKKTSSDVFYYGTNIATVNRLGKFTSTEYNFSFDLASTTLKIESADIQKYGKSNSAAYKLITTATPVEAKLLTKNTRVSLVCDTTKVIIPDAPAAKFTATIPAVDEDVVISWYVDGVVTGYTGTEYVFRALPTHAGKTIKVKAEAKGVRSGVVISSDEMSLTASLSKASTKTDGNTIKDNELKNARVERTIK